MFQFISFETLIMYCILSALPLREDLEYWMIDAAYMEFCCSEKFFMKRDILQVFKHLNLDPMFFFVTYGTETEFFFILGRDGRNGSKA